MKSLYRIIREPDISSGRHPLILFVLVIALALILSACSSVVKPAQVEIQLSDLNAIEEVKGVFNQDTGKPRIILLLSPT